MPVALITGGAQRIGAAIAQTLHQAQYHVIIHYHHSKTEALALQQSFEKQRPNSCALLQANLCEYSQLQPLIDDAYAQWGRLDVLINNASRFYPTPIGQADKTQWDDLINSNLMSPYFLSQFAYPYLKKTDGCIINITDIKAERPLRDYDIYCASKAGLQMLTESLALACAPEVRVNAIAPGVTLWPTEKINRLSDETKKKIIEKIPLKQMGSIENITNAILFLINNSHITGQTIRIDGGQSL